MTTERYTSPRRESRNAWPPVHHLRHGYSHKTWWGDCDGCGATVEFRSSGCTHDSDPEPLECEPLRLWMAAYIPGDTIHCFTCHAPDHNSCRTCGDCMETIDVHGQVWATVGRTFSTAHGQPRIDKAYCSNACRQKAYRTRRREAYGE